MTSQRDQQVLDFLFSNNPNPFAFQSAPAAPPPAAPTVPAAASSDNSESFYSREEEEEQDGQKHSLASVEVAAVKFAEQNNPEEAERLLTEGIEKHPEYASFYNNRAQVRRIIGKRHEAMEDLNRCIELLENDKDDKIRNKKNVMRLAYTQRGILYKLASDVEHAREDFGKAGCLGSKFAEKEAASMHPMAQLCNAAVMQMLTKLEHT